MTTIEKTVLPLSPLDMVNFFKDKDKVFVIDYFESKKTMSPKSILVYLSNLQITCEFDAIDADLVTEYLYLKDMCNVEELDLFVANLIFFNKYQQPFADMKAFLECGEQILADNKEVIDFYTEVMESSTLFILGKCHDEVKGVEKPQLKKFGLCFLNLYKIPDFLIAFLQTIKPLEEQTMFMPLFDNEDYGLKGSNMFSYFAVPENLFYQYLTNLSRMLDLKNNVNEENVDALNRMVDIYDTFND